MTRRHQAIAAGLVLGGVVLFVIQRTPMSAQSYGRGPAAGAMPSRDAFYDSPLRPANPQDFYRRGVDGGPSLRRYSWGYRERPKPREIKVQDIVTILIDEKAEVTLNSRFDRTRTAEFQAALEEFIRFAKNGSIQNTGATSPTIDVSNQQRFQSTGRATDQEGIRTRIAATVMDVLPNGNLVLEARKTVSTNQDYWEYSLTGVVRSADVEQNNTILSENIANLNIGKKQKGRIFGSTRLGWGSQLIDMLWPF